MGAFTVPQWPPALSIADYDAQRADPVTCAGRVWDFGRADTVAFARSNGWEGFLRARGYDPERATATYCIDGRWFLAVSNDGVAS